MDVNPDIVGKDYPAAAPYEVGREKIREFAEAIRSTDPVHTDIEAAKALGYPDVIAPPTLAVLIAQRAEAAVYVDPEARIDFSRVVHGEQHFRHHRPIVAGDRLSGRAHVDKVRSAGGNTMITTRVELTDQAGEAVTTVVSTMVVRGEGA